MQSEKEKKNELTVKYNGGSGAVFLYMKCEEVTEAPILNLVEVSYQDDYDGDQIKSLLFTFHSYTIDPSN